MDIFHYVYKLTHIETKEFYFGSRTCKVKPSVDPYKGSMVSWKPNKSKLKKEIIRNDFKCREDCILFERNIIIKHKYNVLNRNAIIPGVGFHTVNTGLFKNKKTGKNYRLNLDDELINSDEYEPFWLGRIHSEETKKKMSKSALNRTIIERNELKRRSGISKNNMKPKTEGHIENIRLAKLGNKNPMFGKTGKDHHNSKSCSQYDINMRFIKIWENAKIASEKLKLSYKAINRCLNGKSKTSGGFIWKYE